MNTKKLLLNILPLLFIGTLVAYAAAPTGGYLPNATLDPDCAPGDTDCFVQVQTITDTNPWFGSDDNNVASDNTEDIYSMGNIGIGIVNPVRKLHIYKDGSSSLMRLESSNNHATIELIGNSFGSKKHWSIGNSSLSAGPDDALVFFDNTKASTRMIIDTNGNVGIGKTSPNFKLEINGNIGISNGGNQNWNIDMIPDGDLIIGRDGYSPVFKLSRDNNKTATIAQAVTLGTAGVNIIAESNDRDASLHVINNSSTGTAYAAIFEGGNVGIGTKNPTSQLQVTGLPIHTNNTAAGSAGLTNGAFYHNGDGVVRVKY